MDTEIKEVCCNNMIDKSYKNFKKITNNIKNQKF